MRRKTQIESVNALLNQPFLNEVEVAAITGRSLPTLRCDRCAKRGFPYFVIGKRSIRYRTSDILAAMTARPVTFEEVRS